MAYRDITSQGASVLWGTRMAERNTETRKRLEKEHNVKVGDKVKIVTEEVSEEDGERRKRKKIKKGDASLLKKLPSYFAFYSLINRFSFLLLHIRRLQHNKQQILLV